MLPSRFFAETEGFARMLRTRTARGRIRIALAPKKAMLFLNGASPHGFKSHKSQISFGRGKCPSSRCLQDAFSILHTASSKNALKSKLLGHFSPRGSGGI